MTPGFEADRLGGLEVEYEAKARWLLEWQVRGFRPLENAIYEASQKVETFVQIQTV
jgi:hypothetical protein